MTYCDVTKERENTNILKMLERPSMWLFGVD